MSNVFEMDEIVITGTKTERLLKHTPVVTQVITRAEIEAAGAENIGEELEHHVGIVVHRDAHGDGVQLQGLASDYVLILLDGEPQVSDRRLFFQLHVFADCSDTYRIIEALEKSSLNAVLGEFKRS